MRRFDNLRVGSVFGFLNLKQQFRLQFSKKCIYIYIYIFLVGAETGFAKPVLLLPNQYNTKNKIILIFINQLPVINKKNKDVV